MRRLGISPGRSLIFRGSRESDDPRTLTSEMFRGRDRRIAESRHARTNIPRSAWSAARKYIKSISRSLFFHPPSAPLPLSRLAPRGEARARRRAARPCPFSLSLSLSLYFFLSTAPSLMPSVIDHIECSNSDNLLVETKLHRCPGEINLRTNMSNG